MGGGGGRAAGKAGNLTGDGGNPKRKGRPPSVLLIGDDVCASLEGRSGAGSGSSGVRRLLVLHFAIGRFVANPHPFSANMIGAPVVGHLLRLPFDSDGFL